jgi:hypothetical protein
MDAGASFDMLFEYTRLVVLSLLGGFFLLIAYRLFTGAINTKGLLMDKAVGGPSPARVQLMLLSMSGAFYYLMRVVDLVQSHGAGELKLPDPPNTLLALVLGSNTVYVTAKASSAARRISNLLATFR